VGGGQCDSLEASPFNIDAKDEFLVQNVINSGMVSGDGK
jgi:hypothetical protein